MDARHRQERNSSVELFRIIATFLVLITHFNELFLGLPEQMTEWDNIHLGQAVICSASITCVNCFLVITGWYGLRFKWKHLWTIWMVLVWIYVPFYVVDSYFYGHPSISGVLFNIFAVGQLNYYVQCYLMLLFLSPILNSFIDRYGRRILPYTLSFWAIEVVFDWILDNPHIAFGGGFQLTHFIFMYLLGRTAFLYREEILRFINVKRTVVIYLSGIVVLTLFYMFISKRWAYSYSDPVNIVMAFVLFLVFEKRKFYSPVINWISCSTLAVYVFHVTPPVVTYLRRLDIYLIGNYAYYQYLIMVAGIIICIFIVAVLYDKIRILVFSRIGDKICDWISRHVRKYSLNG